MSTSEEKLSFIVETSPSLLSIDDRSHLSGVDTRGCDCFHHGMSPAWHSAHCAWITKACNGRGDHA
jgi:hypothetical protein